MDEQFNTILSIALFPNIVYLIMEKHNMDDISAMNEFYMSVTYELLCDERTKMWHYSPLAIYHMWKIEKETGKIVYPEEEYE